MGQLSVPIHNVGDNLVVSEIPLSSALDFACQRVEKIKGDVVSRPLILGDMFTSLGKPLSTERLLGTDTLPWDEPTAIARQPQPFLFLLRLTYLSW